MRKKKGVAVLMGGQGNIVGRLGAATCLSFLMWLPVEVAHGQGAEVPGWTYHQTISDLDMPRAAVILPADDQTAQSVVVADRTGVRLLTYDQGSLDDSLGLTIFDDVGRPSSLVAGEDERLYIADADRHHIVVLDAWGAPLATWGGPNELFEPGGLALDEKRQVLYVADTGQHRIATYGLDGTVKGYWHGPESAPLSRPTGLAVGKDGQLVIADTGNHRLLITQPEALQQRHGPARVVGQWGMYPSMLDEPTSVQIIDGLIYVTERRNHRVQVFDMNGRSRGMWGTHALMPHQGEGKLHYPDQFLISDDGNWALIVEGLEDRLQVFKPGAPLAAPSSPQGVLAQETKTHFGAHPAMSGELLVIPDPETHQVYVFRMTGQEPILITQFGMRGTGAGRFMDLSGVAIDGNVIEVLDPSTSRLAQFELDWKPEDPLKFDPLLSRLVTSRDFRNDPSAAGERGLWPGAMVSDETGRRFMIDQANAEVLVVNPDGTISHRVGQDKSQQVQLNRPTSLALDGQQRLYVVDTAQRQVVVFDLKGQYLKTLGSPDVFERPFGVAIDEDRAYVTDRATGEIVVLNVETGQVMQRIAGPGGRGFEVDQMFKPAGLVVDQQGRVIVLDEGNHRGQIWSPEGDWLVTFGLGRSYTPNRRPRPIQDQ